MRIKEFTINSRAFTFAQGQNKGMLRSCKFIELTLINVSSTKKMETDLSDLSDSWRINYSQFFSDKSDKSASLIIFTIKLHGYPFLWKNIELTLINNTLMPYSFFVSLFIMWNHFTIKICVGKKKVVILHSIFRWWVFVFSKSFHRQ